MLRTVRSFVCRNRAMTAKQADFWNKGYQRYGISVDEVPNHSSVILEIGFGNGDNLFALAKNYPEYLFIGVEVYLDGFRKLFRKLEQEPLNNLKVIRADVVEVLQHLPENSLIGSLILFPDPWPKKRNHKRRLINSDFIFLLARKLKIGGGLLIKTDCQNYAEQIQQLFCNNEFFIEKLDNWKIVQTHFERKGLLKGHTISSFSYAKKQ